MRLLFRHKDSDCIVDKDYFGEHDFLKIRTDKGLIYWNLESILNSDDWDVIVPDYLSHEELHKLAYILYNDIAMNGDQYWVSNTLHKIEELALLYNIEGENILS